MLAVTFDYSFVMWLGRWAIICFVVLLVLFLVRAFLGLRERKQRQRNAADDYKSMGEISEITL